MWAAWSDRSSSVWRWIGGTRGRFPSTSRHSYTRRAPPRGWLSIRTDRSAARKGPPCICELRSYLAVSLADSERRRLRAVRLREETATLAARRRRRRVHDLPMVYAERDRA